MLKTIFDEYAHSLNTIFIHDRTKTVGASEIGQCSRKTFAIKREGTKRGVARDAEWQDQWGARIRGKIMESAFWAPALKAKYGNDLLYSGEQQITLKSEFLSATPDGILMNQPRDVLKHLGVPDIRSSNLMVECKTLDPRTNMVEAKVENWFQTQVQMGLMRETTSLKPMYNLLTYTDASFWSEIMEFPIEFEPATYKAAKDRAATIMTADKFTDLPPEGWIAGGKECTWCPFVKACGVERRSVPQNSKNATPQFVAEITDYALEANRVEAFVLQEEAKLRKIQDTIKNRLREKSVRRIQGVVNWYEVAGSVRYSAKGMKARLLELGEDVECFAKESEPTDRLIISAIPTPVTGIRQVPEPLKKKRGKVMPKKKDIKHKHPFGRIDKPAPVTRRKPARKKKAT